MSKPKQQETKLRKAVDSALQTATQRPTNANRKALRGAQRELESFLQSQIETEPIFKNIPELIEFLESENWRIGQSTAYEHRDQGKLKLRKNGSISQTEALTYARQHLKMQDGSDPDHDDNLQQEKLRKDITRLDYDGKMRELKYRQQLGELIERSQVEIELSGRTTNLKNYLDTFARREVGKICKILGGDPQKIPEAKTFMLEANRRAFDNYSRPIVGVEDDN